MRRKNNTFYVSVEGDCEKWYLEKLQALINSGNYPYSVHFVIKKTNPISFAKATANGYSEFSYYHICDYEGNGRDDTNKFIHVLDNIKDASQITKIGYKLSYSNLCFELWIILHKKIFNRSITNKSVYKDEINDIFKTKFESLEELKKSSNFNNKILPFITIEDVKNAICNAKTIQCNNKQVDTISEYKGSKYYKKNPSLNIHEFIELVLKECHVI